MTSQTPTRRVTAADIAKSLGVSRATVGFVLNETPGQTISAATTERVLSEARRLGYRPHVAARALASGRSNIVLLVLPDWPIDHSLRSNIDEATHALDEHGYALITFTPHDGARSRPLWETLQPDVVMGMFPFSEDLVRSMRDAGVERIVPSPDPESPTDATYSEEGPRLQIEHLRDLGHTRIGFARPSDPRLVDLADAREAVAAAACAAAALPEPLTLHVGEPDVDPPIREWLDAGITAVAAYNDDVAATVIGAATREGVSVPRDLSVVGHDDTPLAMMFEPRITSVRINTTGLGQQLAALAMDAMNGTSTANIEQNTAVSLIPRGSSAPAPGPRMK